MQLFVSDKGFLAVYPMRSKAEFPDALKLFCKEIGVPERLIVDGAREQTSRKVKSFTQEVGTTLQVLEENTQWANRAELYIGLLKKQIRKDLQESKSPMVLWHLCAQRRALINNLSYTKITVSASGENCSRGNHWYTRRYKQSSI